MHEWWGKWQKDQEMSLSALSQPSITIQLHLQWQDVGFVCPVSVNFVFARAKWRETFVWRLLLCVYRVNMMPKYIYTDIFISFFQSCLWWTHSTCSFVNQQICLCIFQCFWDKNMLHIVSCILACVRMVIWYNTLYSCFVFLGIAVPLFPPFQRWLPHINHLSNVDAWATSAGKNLASSCLMIKWEFLIQFGLEGDIWTVLAVAHRCWQVVNVL